MPSLRHLLNDPPWSSPAAFSVQLTVALLIVAVCAAVILESVPEFQHHMGLFGFELLVTLVFTIELILRFLAASSFASFFTIFNLLDLVALMPGYVQLSGVAIHGKFRELVKMVWFLRLVRLVKIGRQLHPAMAQQLSGAMMSRVFNSSALAILAVLSFLIVVSASLLYLVESDRCEERGLPCHGFESIPASFWFSTITLTTVGYGDVYPFTAMGRALASFLAVCAVILLSLSSALLSVNLADTQMTTHKLDASEREMVAELQKAWDHLAHALAVATAAKGAETGEGSALPLRPTLQLLEDKGRSLCFEMQECLSLLQS